MTNIGIFLASLEGIASTDDQTLPWSCIKMTLSVGRPQGGSREGAITSPYSDSPRSFCFWALLDCMGSIWFVRYL